MTEYKNQLEDITRKKSDKYWSPLVIILVVLAIIIIIFSFFAPYIFTATSYKPQFDFTLTGPIGDTLGGIMNPFIALAGILITFLAFYMQIEANKLQIRIFQNGLEAEKNKKIREEKIDCYGKLSVLKLDLDSVITDVKVRSVSLQKYYNDVEKNPFRSNVLIRTPTFNYARTADLDRLAIYKGFKHFSEDKEWIKHFTNIYQILDFLSEAFKSIYEIFKYHSEENFREKENIRDELNQLIDDLFIVHNTSHPTSPLIIIINEVLSRNANFTRKSDIPIETDLKIIQNNVIEYFIEEALRIKESDAYKVIQKLVIVAMNISKKITRVSYYEMQTGETAKITWTSINQGNEGKESVLQKIEEIKNYLETLLDKNKDILN